jgi:hypothetical protein
MKDEIEEIEKEIEEVSQEPAEKPEEEAVEDKVEVTEKHEEDLQDKVEKEPTDVVKERYEQDHPDYDTGVKEEEFKPDYQKEDIEYKDTESALQPKLVPEPEPDKKPGIGSEEEHFENYLESLGQIPPKAGDIESERRKEIKNMLKKERGYKN